MKVSSLILLYLGIPKSMYLLYLHTKKHVIRINECIYSLLAWPTLIFWEKAIQQSVCFTTSELV